ncbi:MAG: hypothetical protein L6243_04185 [Candidatus Altiarchaeales archaeon]|nr:hypothetical protein [Candidatus Altiarchaeota archaeon]MBU4436957.1 hypothetical protein [Candidatus Altiarchaeota archaeon]MCG2782768.1 hypothetical protein [Candidatus Altiarchaeales archaeon]
MPGKKFGNQTVDQILKHLINLLDPTAKYTLSVDPLNVHFTIREAFGKAPRSEKRNKLRAAQKNLSTGQKKHIATKKTTRPKIRTIKKGRTVNLKGQVY